MSTHSYKKLIIEAPTFELEHELVQENRDAAKKYFLTGKYLMMNKPNQNRRIYKEDHMLPAVEVFKKVIAEGRGVGENGHSQSPEVNMDRISHKIVSLERSQSEPEYFIGKSLILDNINGDLLKSYVNSGIVFGMSSKSAGVLAEKDESKNVTYVESINLISVDAVFSPSVESALMTPVSEGVSLKFVDGILENKNFYIANDGKLVESFEKFEKAISKYPSKYRTDINTYIIECFKKFVM